MRPVGTRVCFAMAIVAVYVAMTASMQSQETAPAKQAAGSNGTPKTIVGCLSGYDGRYTLGTSTDDLYELAGDPDLFKRYNGKKVQATGTVSQAAKGTSPNNALSQQPPRLNVSKLKKLADNCFL